MREQYFANRYLSINKALLSRSQLCGNRVIYKIMKPIDKNIYLYYLFKILVSLEFFGPVIVLFWMSKGLLLSQIMLLQSIFAFTAFLFEIPTGIIADKYSKKLSLILGSAATGFGFIIYGYGTNFYHFALAEIIIACGYAFNSGADQAFIFDSLRAQNKSVLFNRVEGKARGLSEIARSIAYVIGGLIGAFNLSFTFILSALVNWISSIVGIFFIEDKSTRSSIPENHPVTLLKQSIITIKSNHRILQLLLYFMIFNSVMWVPQFFIQPYFTQLQIPLSAFGILFALIVGSASLGSFVAEKLEKKFSSRTFILLIVISFSCLLLLGLFPSIYLLPLWGILFATLVTNDIIVSNQLLPLIPQNKTATILSVKSLLRRLAYAIYGPLLGYLADITTITTALILNSCIFIGLLFIVYLFNSRLINVSIHTDNEFSN